MHCTRSIIESSIFRAGFREVSQRFVALRRPSANTETLSVIGAPLCLVNSGKTPGIPEEPALELEMQTMGDSRRTGLL